MKIEELQNKRIKISENSITCKDENGKTAGIVRGTKRFLELQLSEQINYFKMLKSAGLYDANEIKNIIFYNKNIYYLFDKKKIEEYEKLFSTPYDWENEKKKYEKINECKKQAIQNKITVIEVYQI